MKKKVKKSQGVKRGSVSKDASGIQTTNFLVSQENWKNRAVLTEVAFEELIDKDDEKIKYNTLKFVFRGSGFVKNPDDPAVPVYVERLFEITGETKKGHSIEKQMLWEDEKISHIFNTFMGHMAHTKVNNGKGLGYTEQEDYASFYKQVAKDFNFANENLPVFKNKEGVFRDFDLVLTYRPDGRLQTPFGNFMDTRPSDRTILRKNVKGRLYSPPQKRNAKHNSPSINMGDMPDIPTGF